jgi:2-polyprenyl-3-methyl-5-hydroxy-6-metoxy-1,4-benzoquinol methylase
MNIVWKDPLTTSKLEKKENFYISNSGEKYKILNKIPRFVIKENYTSAFGIQWNYYRKTQLDSYTGLPISEVRLKRCLGESIFSNLKGKNILEAGCGAGRFTEVLLSRDSNVMSVDMSDAVDANQLNFPQDQNHTIAQADINRLPFMPNQFDLVICLGVIQHTEDPGETLQSLYEQVKPGGWLIIDHYAFSWSHETQIAKKIARFILRRMKIENAFLISRYLTKFFLPLHRVGRSSILWQALMRRLTPVVSYYNDFPELTDELQMEWALLDTHDNLTDHYKHFTTKERFTNSMKRLGLSDIECWKGGIGIEGRGRKPIDSKS